MVYEPEDMVPGFDIPIEVPPPKAQLACFCCGICCHYRVFISLEEAQRISADQKIPLEAFLDLAKDHFWFGQESFLISQRNGYCVFLTGDEKTNGRFCRIHHVKPSVCREWTPTFHRPECQKGLAIYWRLTIDDTTGTIRGEDEAVRKFDAFMKKLNSGD